jgi:hypothetical protein
MFGIFKKDDSLKMNFETKMKFKLSKLVSVHLLFLAVLGVVVIVFGLNTFYHLRADSEGKKSLDLGYEVVKSVHNFVGNIQKRKLVIIQGDIMEPIFYDGDQACLDINTKDFALNNVIIYQGATEDEIFIRKISGIPGSNVVFENTELSLKDDEYLVQINNLTSSTENKQTIVNKSKILGKIINEIESASGSLKCLAKY